MVLRCFIAIEISEAIKKNLRDIIDIFRKTGADVKWTSPENIHITLKFLGDTDESVIPMIINALDKKMSIYSPFYIKIAGIGCFPDRKRPRVIWIGIEKAETLQKLNRDVEQEMVQYGYEAEKRVFSPHLTIGRVRSSKGIPELLKKFDEFAAFSFNDLNIRNITLIKSTLKPAGAEYSTLAEIPLGRRRDVEQG